jgi:hypothetical protein
MEGDIKVSCEMRGVLDIQMTNLGSAKIWISLSRAMLIFPLVKNKEMLAEVVIDTTEEGVKEYSKEVYNLMKMASVVGMTWGGDDTKMLDMFSARERKAKGMRELKNLNCSVSPVKSQRRRGRVGAKNDISFPPEIH